MAGIFDDIFGRGGPFADGVRAKSRLRNAAAAFDEERAAGLRAQNAAPTAIIGGQFFAQGQTEGRNEALQGLREREADAAARRRTRGVFGSDRVTRGVPGGLGGGVDLGSNVDEGTLTPDESAASTTRQSLLLQSDSVPSRGANNSTRGIAAVDAYNDQLYKDTLGSQRNFRNGGLVDKQKMMKQPGYMGSGKVKLPDGYKSGGAVCKRKGGMRGYATGGQIGDEAMDDGRDTVDVRVREGEYMLNPETVAAFGAGDYDAGTQVLDGIVTATTGEEPGPVPVNEAGEEIQQGMRNGGRMGYAPGGPVQFDMFGNPVGPETNRWYQFRPSGYQAPEEGVRFTRNDTRFQGPQQPQGTSAPKPARNLSGFRKAISGKNTTTVGQAVKGAGRGIARGARAAGGGGAGLARGALPVAGISGAVTGFGTPTEDYAKRFPVLGIEAGESLGGDLALRGVGVLSDVGTAVVDPLVELGNWATGSDMETFRERFADVQAGGSEGGGLSFPGLPFGIGGGTTPAETEAAPTPDPNVAYRAFSNAPVDLRNMNVVQQVGPGEAIIREDVNGVPTFTNVRQGGFNGSAANLQAEADKRAAEDAIARQNVLRNVARERELFDAATAPAALDREAGIAQAAARSGSKKTDDLLKSVSARFSQQGTDEDGNLTAPVVDVAAERTFLEAMSQLIDPATGLPMTAVLEDLTEGERQPFYEEFERVYRNTLLAQAAARRQGIPVDNRLRAGADELRLEPTGREVRFGDAWPFGDEATWGEWWQGLGNDDPSLNRYVVDPRSGAQIPASRVTRGGMDAETMRALGLIE